MKLKTYVKIEFDNIQKIMENVIALTYRDVKKTDKFKLLDEVKKIIFNSIVNVEVEQ